MSRPCSFVPVLDTRGRIASRTRVSFIMLEVASDPSWIGNDQIRFVHFEGKGWSLAARHFKQ